MESANCNPNHEGGGEDRLSSLPDDILTEILSRLPINSAVTTSVLSHRWRHLWTGITRFEFHTTKIPTIIPNFSCILRHLTSTKLDVFKVKVSRRIYWHDKEEDDGFESCIHDICRRKVQQVISNIFFPMPDCLLNCRSLVILDLYGPYEMKYEYKAADIQLPNLKKLSLRFLTFIPHWLGSLHKSSPLLEDLTLASSVHFMQSISTIPLINIIFPNLKSLELGLFPYNVEQTPGINSIFSIDAPKLTNLVTYGCVLPYGFRTNPPALVKACINLRKYVLRHEDLEVELHRFPEFFKGMSSVSNLELVVMMEGQRNMFTYLNLNPPIMFFNLVRLEVTLCGFSLNDCTSFVVSLQRFPNLEHLWVIVNRREREQNTWCAPNVVPSCLISKLKIISISIRGFGRNNCWIEFLRYILGKATVLQNLNVCLVHNLPERVEHKFCKSLFKLPRSSLNCEVVFSGRFVKGLSSNVFKIGNHNVNYRPWLIDIFWCYLWLTKRQFSTQANIEDTADYVLFDSDLSPFQYDEHI
ncbi:FBD-associated F-box protein At5g18780-like [Chenopodium quinoa]|uniref:F-box domain-containing protein n=1 Tax=Chenopodium quinoa TaxID=63459 RepID=A0A803LB21_CHEQI|nr:FBD-associated F-box protein At5g18780-like [Chenopodium quinoa]